MKTQGEHTTESESHVHDKVIRLLSVPQTESTSADSLWFGHHEGPKPPWCMGPGSDEDGPGTVSPGLSHEGVDHGRWVGGGEEGLALESAIGGAGGAGPAGHGEVILSLSQGFRRTR